jgi:hypothetical protein
MIEAQGMGSVTSQAILSNDTDFILQKLKGQLFSTHPAQ